MTLKRSLTSDSISGSKKLKHSQSGLVDAFIHENLRQCSECQKGSLTECINVDFSPKIYFSLALILEDPSCDYLLGTHDDLTVCQLGEYACKLSVDQKMRSHILSKLAALCSQFTTDSIQELSALMSLKRLHQHKELMFISTFVETVSATTAKLILKQSTNEDVDLSCITFSDIRVARILPLLAIMYDDAPAKTVDLTVSDDDVFLLSNLSFKENSDMDMFELDENGSILDSFTLQETPDPFIFPPPSQITLPDDNSETYGSPLRLQSPDRSLQSFPNSQEMSIPDYEIYTTPELKSKLKQYGFKTSSNRTTLIKDLQRIYSSINSTSSQASVVSQKGVTNSDTESGIASPSSQNPEAETRKKIINHIKSNPNLMNKILNYESVSIDECNVGLNCKKSAVKLVLDEFGASSQVLNKKPKISD